MTCIYTGYLFVFSICAGLNLKDVIDEEVHRSGLNDGAFEGLSTKMAGFLVASKSDNTNKKYYIYFTKWERFISEKGGSAIPASPIHIALYLTELMDKHSSNSVISTTVYSIKWAHSLKNLPDPTNNLFVKNLLEASKRTLSKRVIKKEPITSETLVALCAKYSESTDVIVIRDLCMILVAYSAFLRFDEMINLHCNDITFYENHFSIFIRKSKIDQYRHGDEIVVTKGRTVACPYAMLNRYFTISGVLRNEDTFLFKQKMHVRSFLKINL